MIKIAENMQQGVDLAFDVPENEQQKAHIANEKFNAILGVLNEATEHLDIMYEPFKAAEQLSEDDLWDRRGAISRYKYKIIENFNNVKIKALEAIKELNYFSVDGTIQEIINSFESMVGDVEENVNDLIQILALSGLKDPDFKDNIVSTIDLIKEQSDQLNDFIKERVIEYIDTNILAKSWKNDPKNKLNCDDMGERIPAILKLVQQQNDVDHALESNKNNQELNPSDANRMWYPGYGRTSNIGDKNDN